MHYAFISVILWCSFLQREINACPDTSTCECDPKTMSVTCSRTQNLVNKLPVGIPLNSRILSINFSTLKRIGPTAFRTTRMLTNVDLSLNKIDFISENAFQMLPRLQTLNLENNRLRLVPEKAFSRSFNLKKLNLSGNKIVVLVPFNFQGLDNLEELYLLQNPTMCIALQAFTGLFKLKRLEMSGMNTTLDSSLIEKLPELRILVLRSFLHVKTIPTDIFKSNKKLEQLYIEHIQLSSGVSSDIFKPIWGLKSLSLKSCSLSRVPRNALQLIKESLMKLDLSHNPLKTISANDFKGMEKLTTLNLRKTGLTVIPSNSLALPRLSSLDLAGNMLSTLMRSVFGNVHNQLKNVSLGNNPWICDCTLKWLAKEKFYHNPNTAVICAEPEGMQGFEIRFFPWPPPEGDYFKCEKPSFTKFGIGANEAKALAVYNNKPVSFDVNCQVKGYPRPTVMWIVLPQLTTKGVNRVKRSDEPDIISEFSRRKKSIFAEDTTSMCTVCDVPSKHKTSNIWVSKNGTLHVRGILGHSAKGLYTCQATNDLGIHRESILLSQNTKDATASMSYSMSNALDRKYNDIEFKESVGEHVRSILPTHANWRVRDSEFIPSQRPITSYHQYDEDDIPALPLRAKPSKNEKQLSVAIKLCRSERCTLRNSNGKIETVIENEYLGDSNAKDSPYLELSAKSMTDTLTRSQTSCCGENSAFKMSQLPNLLSFCLLIITFCLL